jgi:hypothetical protein
MICTYLGDYLQGHCQGHTKKLPFCHFLSDFLPSFRFDIAIVHIKLTIQGISYDIRSFSAMICTYLGNYFRGQGQGHPRNVYFITFCPSFYHPLT